MFLLYASWAYTTFTSITGVKWGNIGTKTTKNNNSVGHLYVFMLQK